MDIAARQRPRPCHCGSRGAGGSAGARRCRGQPDRAPPGDRARVLPGRQHPEAAISRLGDAAVRPLLASPGHRLGTARNPCEAALARVGGTRHGGRHRDGADCSPRLRRRPSVPDRAGRPPRHRHLPRAPGSGRIRVRQPGDGARRVRGAGLVVRSLPDGGRRAAAHRPARRRDREPAGLRPGQPAFDEPHGSRRAAPGPRVSDLPGCGVGVPARMAAAIRGATRHAARSTGRSARAAGLRASSTTCRCSSARPLP